jgi:hypothetical protein
MKKKLKQSNARAKYFLRSLEPVLVQAVREFPRRNIELNLHVDAKRSLAGPTTLMRI